MRKLNEYWFSFKGVRSDQMGVRLTAMPSRTRAALTVKRQSVPGHDGTVKYGTDFYADATVKVTFDVPDDNDLDQVNDWLSGSGDLIISNEPGLVCRASIEKEMNISSILARFAGQRFSMTFTCEPYRYFVGENDTVITGNYGTVVNQGSVESLPRIKIEGTGEMTVFVGDYQIDTTGSVIVDSEAVDCLDPVTLFPINNRVSLDEFPVLVPGESEVSWEGNVTRVTITPRSRCR